MKRHKKAAPFKFLVPLIYAPVLPLSKPLSFTNYLFENSFFLIFLFNETDISCLLSSIV